MLANQSTLYADIPPTIDTLELKPDQEIFQLPFFYGLESENPCEHLNKLVELCLNDEEDLLTVFPLSMLDRAKDWFYSLSSRSNCTWGEMQKEFLNYLCPMYETHILIRKVLDFYQRDEESFLQCWWRFKCLLLSWSSVQNLQKRSLASREPSREPRI